MKIALGADGSGYCLTQAIKEDLMKQGGYEIIDTNPDGPVYYADAARAVAWFSAARWIAASSAVEPVWG